METAPVFHADAIGCHVITVTNDLLKKLDLIGKDLDEYSLETVRMFHDDARKAGFSSRSTTVAVVARTENADFRDAGRGGGRRRGGRLR